MFVAAISKAAVTGAAAAAATPTNSMFPSSTLILCIKPNTSALIRKIRKSSARRYGLAPYGGPPRRIFFGTLVADENWDVFRMHAIEIYGIYHVAVFIEANTTFMATPRKLRFKDSEERDLLAASGMFGNNTHIYFDYWLHDWPELEGMDRESEQRNTIIRNVEGGRHDARRCRCCG
jgi:hypothetical protein